jgi:hypothetical protein
MPKPVRDLLEKQRPLSDRVLDFLQKQRELGFTVPEIAAHMVADGNEAIAPLMLLLLSTRTQEEREQVLRPVQAALQQLEASGLVRSFRDGTDVYYAHEE